MDLTHATPEVGDVTRKQQLATDGHFGHARSLTQSINYTSTHEHQPFRRLHGWGSTKKHLKQNKDVRCLPEDRQYHKKHWDHDATRTYMHTTGWFSHHLDALMGVSFEDMEGLSVRQQREMIKRRAFEMNRLKTMKYKFGNSAVERVTLNNRINPFEQMEASEQQRASAGNDQWLSHKTSVERPEQPVVSESMQVVSADRKYDVNQRSLEVRTRPGLTLPQNISKQITPAAARQPG